MEIEIQSCLKPIIIPLRALKIFGGFPLTINFTEGHTELTFSCFEGIKILVSILVFYFSWTSMFVYDGIESMFTNGVSLNLF